MSAIREPGRVNENTILIDTGQDGIWGTTATYLVEGNKRCLVDTGTRADAPRVARALKELDAFPPDIVIVTHSHFDHAQGIPALREAAAREGRTIEVMAARKAIPLLLDPSYQEVFGPGPYESITDVVPLDEGDTIDLGGTTLRIYDVPGHTKDHIAILDESTENIFLGDAIGAKLGDSAFIPVFVPPFWDPEAFDASIEKLKQLDYESLCLAHFGCISGAEAIRILDEATAAHEQWWRIFEENEDLLDDIDRLLEVVLEETGLELPRVRTVSPIAQVMLGVTIAWNRLIHGRTWSISKLLLPGITRELIIGYRTYKGL